MSVDADDRRRPLPLSTIAWLVMLASTLLPASADLRASGEGDGPTAELLLLDLDGRGVCLTDVQSGVTFRLAPKAPPVRTAWTCPLRANAFLAIDVTRNGRIDGVWEVVGGMLGPKNGFDYLSVRVRQDRRWSPTLEAVGVVDGRADLYQSLILWTDLNHNGLSEESELQSLAHAGVLSIALAAERSDMPDAAGNTITRSGVFTLRRGVATVSRPAVTVRLAWSYDGTRGDARR
jgi:hypothetical protein